MATEALSNQETSQIEAQSRARTLSGRSPLAAMLMPLASLKLTVGLFAAATFLVFAGTLAQREQDIWEVMTQYFRTSFAWIDFQIFFPRSVGGKEVHVPGGFYFPGGWIIGGAMAVNLFAAHALRFKIQAHGPRLAAGLAVIALGVLLTWMVVLGGTGKETIESAAPFEWSLLWTAIKWTFAAVWITGAYALSQLDKSRKIEFAALVVAEIVLGGLVALVFLRGGASLLGDSSLRILWQLIKGGLAGLVLLGGCWLVFRKRAGIVLLHAGVALVMVNELVVAKLHVERQMQIREGETVQFAQDIRTVELAVVESSDATEDDVVVVPRGLLRSQQPVKDDHLPFDLRVVEYLQNARLTSVDSGERNLANAGIGVETKAVAERPGAGADAGSKADLAASYVELIDKKSQRKLGTYLFGIAIPPQKIEVDGKTYNVALRFERDYKPYTVKLLDFRFDKYQGTQTPKNYSSDVRLVDPARGVDQEVKIWMNNPLRYAGETFYQSSYFVEGGREGTVLQVVENTGWMIPYVACMLVATGMLAQFSISLGRFLQGRAAKSAVPLVQPARRKSPRAVAVAGSREVVAQWFPLGVVLLAALLIAYLARAPRSPMDQLQIAEFGRIPVVHEGRVKPLDTVARNVLRYLSGKQTFKDETLDKPVTAPAIQWLADVIARPKVAIEHRVFRIENLEVLQTLGLERREGLRYSIDEILPQVDELDRQVKLALGVEPIQLTVYQKKLLELDKKLELWRLLNAAFDPPQLNADNVRESLARAMRQLESLAQAQPPLIVPPEAGSDQWQAFATAWFAGRIEAMRGQEPNRAIDILTEILVAYSQQEAKSFNHELAQYESFLSSVKPEGYDADKVNFEAFFNRFEPIYWAAVLYVVAFVLAALGWLGWTRPLQRAAFWLIVFTLLVHTFGLLARIYISGRPPVTNLYSSAVFIGWAGVVLGLVLESIFQLGIGNVVAAVAGFVTLMIAHFLASMSQQDTLSVLQAVLDTQFWLATHVVCVTLGYSTTFFAGLLGVIYVLGSLTRRLSDDVKKDLSRMTYGTVCFAMFFSFVGTVLGGLWADDSWGRFWGWDPKENGALMIVLWNALILHARWGGIVKQRGLAALAVAGNIVTSWSWFGVNELSVGLHSYGFTEGVRLMLLVFVLSQLAIIALAMLPTDLWMSLRKPRVA